MTFEDFWEQMGWQDSGYKNNFKSCWNACAQEYKVKIKEAMQILDQTILTEKMDNEGIRILRDLIKE